jgi:hypothetical protein
VASAAAVVFAAAVVSPAAVHRVEATVVLVSAFFGPTIRQARHNLLAF